jgi:translocator protein
MTAEIPWKALAVAGAVALVCALAGGLLTEIGPWYRGLKKPSFQPPDWLFGPAWTVIYTLTAIAAALAWRDAPTDGARSLVVTVFVINAILNIAWSFFFFKLKQPSWALIEVALLWASVLSLVVVAWPISRLAGLMLVPYLAWVSFASILNWAIVRLNG